MSAFIGGGLSVIASLLKAASELTSKYSLDDDLNPYIAALGYRMFALPILSILVIIFGIPNLESEFWIAISINAPISVVATILYMKALQLSDISLVSPIKALTPMALLVTSPIILGEFASIHGTIGVLFVTFGVYTLKISAASLNDILGPFKSITKEKGVQYAFIIVILYSISSNVGKIGVEASSPFIWTFAIHLLVSTILIPIVYYKVNGVVRRSSESKWQLLAMGSFSALAVVAQSAAYLHTLVVYVIAIKRTALLWNILGGSFLLDEKGIKQRLPGGILIVIGIIIISTAL